MLMAMKDNPGDMRVPVNGVHLGSGQQRMGPSPAAAPRVPSAAPTTIRPAAATAAPAAAATATATAPVSSLPVSSLPVGTPKPVSTTPTTSGLMGAATAAKVPPIGAATYNPTGYSAQLAASQGYTAATYDPTMVDRTGINYDPTTQAVDPNQLTSTQLNALTAGNSKYIQQARQAGLEQAAQSGLMASSIAAGNSTRAAIQAALPIAQQDAARFGSVADQNMAATNTAGQFNAGQTLSASTTDSNAANTADQFNAGETNQASAFTANAANTASQFNANSTNQAAAYNANASNEAGQFNVGQINTVNTDQQAKQIQQDQFGRSLNAQQSNAYFAQQFNREQQMSQVMTSIYENPNLTAEQQQTAALNAKVVLQGLQQATDATFAAGVPSVFTNV